MKHSRRLVLLLTEDDEEVIVNDGRVAVATKDAHPDAWRRGRGDDESLPIGRHRGVLGESNLRTGEEHFSPGVVPNQNNNSGSVRHGVLTVSQRISLRSHRKSSLRRMIYKPQRVAKWRHLSGVESKT